MSDFWDLILDAALDALIDTAKMLPFLFAVYLLIEYLEHKASDKFAGALRRLGPFGPVGGAVLGCIPQCGFSVAVSNLYSGRLVSLGTLLAVYIATSDEAVPILLSDPTKISSVGMLIAAKLVIAIAAGLLTDLAVKVFHKKKNVDNAPYEDLCRDCGCDEHGILYSATKHTVQIFLFLLAVSFVLGITIGALGEERLNAILMTDSVFQPLLAALIGLIPNCAPSVILTNLYMGGSLSFGSVVAGLSTGAGLGLVVLFKTNRRIKENITIVVVLYLISALSGLLIDLIM